MKYVLFLNELELISREDIKKLLVDAKCNYQPIWLTDGINKALINHDVEIIVTREHKVDKSLLKDYPNMKTLSLAFTGYDEANVGYFQSKKINVYNVPNYAITSVAELNIGLTLSLLRRFTIADKFIRKGESERNEIFYPGIELANKNVGIIGTGKIGIETARIFNSFHCIINGYSRTHDEKFTQIGGKYLSKKKLLTESDIIILSLPLNQNTKNFVNSSDFDLMKEGAILINTSRSELINEKSLLKALKSKKIWAGIDVTKEPECINKEFYDLENVILTPHIGYKTKEALKRLAEVAIMNVGDSMKNITTNIIKKRQ